MPSTCWIRRAGSPTGIRALSTSRATRPTRSSASTFPASTRPMTLRPGFLGGRWTSPSERAASRPKGGAGERTAAASGRAWSSMPFATRPATLIGFAKVTRDLTERREAQLELERSQQALFQAQKMEAVGQLTGGLAHDFNNLLTGITGSLDLMKARLAQGRISELERYITAASGAASRAATLTHRLLAFSRQQTLEPEAGRCEPSRRRHRGVGAAHGRARHRDRDRPGRRTLALLLRSEPARERHPQPLHQRARRDAGVAVGSRSRRRTRGLIQARPPNATCRGGSTSPSRVTDTGTGMPPDVVAARLRSVFHHEARRQRAPASACR